MALLLPAGVVAVPNRADAAVIDAPPPVTNLHATVVDLDAVKLTWDASASPGITETVIRGKEGLTPPTSRDDGFAVTPDTSVLPSATASDLPDPNVPYTFAVFSCNAPTECASATVTVDSYVVTASVSKDRVTYGHAVNLTGKVVDALTGAAAEYADIRAVALYSEDDGELVAQDFSRAGGVYKLSAQPQRLAEFGVIAMSDATHLGGFGFTKAVHVSADVALAPNTKKARLGTTFQLAAAALPVRTTLPVVLQEKVKGTWKTVVKQKPNKKGVTVFKVKPKTRGKHVYRASRGPTPGVNSGTSKELTITVT
jgi:hypothetical protein